MTISSALQHAMSGLRTASRATDVIAGNISNATTPGYARRVLEQSATSANGLGGVTVTGVSRIVDPALLATRRSAQSDLGYAESISAFLNQIETEIGTPDNPASLNNALADFETALLSASSRPDAPERLTAAVNAATRVVSVVNTASSAISDMRSAADQSIEAQVKRLNAALEEVEHLNTQIARTEFSGQDTSALQDLRQGVIDEIHEIVPVRTTTRDDYKIALYSEGGVILLDGPAVSVEFTPSKIVTPYQTLEDGLLSGLSINGRDLRTGSSNGNMAGGTLAAQFAIRDELGVDAMSQLDAFSRALVERFEAATGDPTRLPSDPGLFTDAGAAFDPADEVGLSERLSLNTAVDPSAGGEVTRLRDGLGATMTGPVGQASVIDDLRDTLKQRTAPASGDFGSGAMSVADIASSMLSRIGVQRLSADQSLSFASAAFQEASQAEQANGVDTDAELQQLILVEQSYAANARMIQIIDEMLDTLMRIGA